MNGSYWSQQGWLLYPRIKTFLHKQNSVRNGGKQKKLLREAPSYLFIYVFLNHEFHIWNIAILTDSCLSAFF